MPFVPTATASYSFSYQITSGTDKKLNRSLSGLNASNSASGEDFNDVADRAGDFLSLIYSSTGFSSIESFTPKDITKKVPVVEE